MITKWNMKRKTPASWFLTLPFEQRLPMPMGRFQLVGWLMVLKD